VNLNRVKFKYFWDGFRPEHNFFRSLVQATIKNGVDCNAPVRIEFHSVFGHPRRLNPVRCFLRVKIVRFLDHFRNRTMLIWYSGENIAPPNYYDLTLSYKADSEANLYLPLWAIYLGLNDAPVHYDREFSPIKDELVSGRILSVENKIPKICTFMTNKDSERFKIAKMLEEMGLLDGYGLAFNREVSSKFEVSSKYLFQLCLENEPIPNYVTEKPIEAWGAGNIPIYLNLDSNNYLNSKAIIDIQGMNVHEIASKVVSVANTNPSSYLEQPILSRAYDFKPIQDRITTFF
jgi:hypothetical protein